VKNTTWHWIYAAALVLCAPLALPGALADANEYQAMGLAGAVDCDGPLVVLVCAVPALFLYLPGVPVFGRWAWSSPRVWNVAAAAVLTLVCTALVVNAASALEALASPSHKEVCGAGW